MIKALTLSTALSALLAAPSLAQESFTPTLSLSAQADVQLAPDYANVSSGVVTRADTARDALAENSRIMERVFAALRSAGISREDMQTSQLSVSPVYSERRPNQTTYVREIIGYEARNTVSAKVEEIERLGRVIDSMAEAGANNINSVSFGAENTDAAMDEARRSAMQALLARADLYAEAGGFELCGLRRLQEGNGVQPFVVAETARFASLSADMSTPVAAGQLTLTASVSAEFCIAQD